MLVQFVKVIFGFHLSLGRVVKRAQRADTLSLHAARRQLFFRFVVNLIDSLELQLQLVVSFLQFVYLL